MPQNMKIEQITITIKEIDDENASVTFNTIPELPEDPNDIEESPVANLGMYMWGIVQELHEGEAITQGFKTGIH